jgi:hypothetical protein
LAVVEGGKESGEGERIRGKRPPYRLTSKQVVVLKKMQLVVGYD